MFVEQLSAALVPYYLQIKFFHVACAMIWLASTSVAYINYLLPAIKAWQRAPDDERLLRQRNIAMERFDQGVVLEHVAFPLLLLSGLLLLTAGPWGLAHFWLSLKLCIVVLVFLPIEAMDYWLSHFGGNKRAIRVSGQGDVALSYEQAVAHHWLFLVVSTPVISVTGLLVLYLAVVKPV